MANYSSDNINEVYDNNQLMYIIYTSGSTGNPKGVMNTHKALNNRLQWMQEKFELGSNDNVLQKTPYSFDVSVWEFFSPLISGATLVIARPGGHRDPDYLKEIIESENITTIHFVPSMLGIFLDSVKDRVSSPLRRVICSGEALTKNHELEFFNKFNETKLFNLYGPTEAAIEVCFWECTGDREESVVPIGFPIANIKLHILNEENEPVQVGEIGELHIGGVGLARGYYGNEELTKKSFIETPEIPYGRLYKTGDLCRYREDQSIEYIGRKDFQVKIRGFRIELTEIEITLERQDYIKQCVVTSIQRGSDALLVAYVTLNQPSFFSESKLRESLAASLPDYMIPSFIIQMDSFPLSMNGKIDRKNLPSPFTDFKIKEQGSIKTKWERRIAGIWEDLLQVQGIGTDVPFLRVGGNSLFAARLVNRIREDLKINVSLKEIFDYSTIKQQALLVGESNRQIVSLENRLVNIQGKIPLSDAQKRLWFINKLEGDSPLYNLPHYIKMQGNLNVLALKESVRKVILHHEIFNSQLSQPAGMKLFKTHLPEEGLQFAMSIYQTLIAVFMIFGPIIGTIVYQNLGINMSILLTGLCFLLSAGALLNIPKDKEQEKEIETRFGQELRSGIKYVLESKELKLLGFCFMVAGLAIGLIQPMNIFIVMEKLQLRGDQLQWLLMANGLGMIFGGIVSMVISGKYPPQRNLAVGVIMNAVTISIIGFSESLPITLGAQFLYGMFLPLIQIAINTMILKSTDSQFIGRVNGILSPLFNGAMVIMIGVSGILKGHVQLTVIYQLSACLFLLTIIFILPLQKKQVRDKKLEIKESL